MSLLNIENLSVKFHNSLSWAVNNISLTINHGETLALVGESGSGKSVTAHTILGLLNNTQASGSITFDNKQLLNKPIEFLQMIRGYDIGMVFQEPMSALNPLHTIFQQIAETIIIHQHLPHPVDKKTSVIITKQDIKDRVIELLNLVGFAEGIDKLDAYPHQLSGGQRQRVMIAIALACSPKLLIADEPTTALDVTIQAGIIDLLQKLKSDLGMALLLISHDLKMVAKLSDRIAVMQHGEILETSPNKILFSYPRHDYTKQLINSEPKGEPFSVPEPLTPVCSVENLTVKFQRNKIFSLQNNPPFTAVDNVNFTLNRAETIGIVGESGSGKTTLAQAILKLISSEGKIYFNQQEITNFSNKEMLPLRADLQIIFQDPFSSLNPRFSVAQIIMEGLLVHHHALSNNEKMNKVLKVLAAVGLDENYINRYPYELSGGQRQRVAIARALILQPKILILDEPTSALDHSIQAEILALLKKLQHEYSIAYLFISHDLSVIRVMSHRIMVMRQGKVIETGKNPQIFTSPTHPYTKELLNSSGFYQK